MQCYRAIIVVTAAVLLYVQIEFEFLCRQFWIRENINHAQHIKYLICKFCTYLKYLMFLFFWSNVKLLNKQLLKSCLYRNYYFYDFAMFSDFVKLGAYFSKISAHYSLIWFACNCQPFLGWIYKKNIFYFLILYLNVLNIITFHLGPSSQNFEGAAYP